MLRNCNLTSSLILLFCLPSALAAADAFEKREPVKVFVLVGQSNMQGHAHIRSLEHLLMSNQTLPMANAILGPDGKPRVHDRIHISYLSANGKKQGPLTTGYGASDEKIGPELSFGIVTQKLLQERIILIKAAWGGKSLNTDFRPPSAGPYIFQEHQLDRMQRQGKDLQEVKKAKQAATGYYYREMLQHVRESLENLESIDPLYDPHAGYELAGLVWFQGWNDMVDSSTYPNRGQPDGYAQYTEVFEHFIRDVRQDFNAPKLPIVIGVLGVGGPVDQYGPAQQRYKGIHQGFRDAMAAPAKSPEFEGSVRAVLTETCWDLELTKLRQRDNELRQSVKQQVKDGSVSRSEERSQVERLRGESFSERERKLLDIGVSNAEFHYLGSAKIMTAIGEAFAEAMVDLVKKGD